MGVCRERRPLRRFCGAACAPYLLSLSVTVIVQLYNYVLAAEAGNLIPPGLMFESSNQM